MTNYNDNPDESNTYSNDLLSGLFDILFGSQSGFTFLISMDSSPTDQRQSIPDSVINLRNILNIRINNQLSNPSLEHSSPIPFFMARSLFRALSNGQADPINPAAQTPHFLEYIQEIFNNMKKKDRVKNQLKKNKPYSYKKKNGKAEECPICLSEFKLRERIRSLDCNHEFHKKCIDKWLLEGNSCCPICRKEPFAEKCEKNNNGK